MTGDVAGLESLERVLSTSRMSPALRALERVSDVASLDCLGGSFEALK